MKIKKIKKRKKMNRKSLWSKMKIHKSKHLKMKQDLKIQCKVEHYNQLKINRFKLYKVSPILFEQLLLIHLDQI